MFSSSVNAQLAVGFEFDASGNPMDGYFDELSYQSDDPVHITHNSDSFEKGAIYDLNGNKTEGLIKYENKKILFKVDDFVYRDKIKPDSLIGLTVGVDSFIVINNFYYKGSLKKEKQFAQLIAEVEGDQFVKYYKFNNVRLQGTPPIVISYLGKKKEDNIWYELKGNKLKHHGSKFFGLVQDFNQRLKAGKFDESGSLLWLTEKFPNFYGKSGWQGYQPTNPPKPIEEEKVYGLIKELEYLNKYRKGRELNFDTHWSEIKKTNSSGKTAKIIGISKNGWELHYYQEGKKVYEINYSSLFPHEREGLFKAFEDGKLVKEVKYSENEPQKVSIFHNESLLYEYFLAPIRNSYGDKIGKEVVYKSIYNQGEDLLANYINGVYNWTDPITDLQYTYDIREGRLVSSYRLENDKKIYQITNADQKLKINKLQRDITVDINTEELQSTLIENAQGTVLVKVLINPDGKADNYKVLGSIHPEFDKVLKDYLDSNILEHANFRITFKALKVKKEKVFFETYIPIQFSINKFYRPAGTNNSWHMNHIMMMQHQQLMIQPAYIPSPPSFSAPSF